MQQTSEQKQNILYTQKGGIRMFKKMKHMKNEKGLTLIELLAVIVILAIIAAIAIPSIGSIINNSEIKAAKADALNILNSANIYITDNPNITTITYDGSGFASTPVPEGLTVDDSFKEYVQSLGAFKGKSFTITNTDGKVTISTGTDVSISAGGKTVKFKDAGVDDIDAGSAKPDGGFVTVD